MDIQQQLSRFLAPLKTRVYNMVVRGVIKIVNDATKVQQMQNTLLAGEVKDGLECYRWYGFTSVPLPGMETAVVFCGGDRSNGIIIGVGDRQFRLKDLKGGEVALYTDEGDYLKFARNHTIQVSTLNLSVNATENVTYNTKTFNVNASDGINLTTPTVTASANVSAGGDINDATSTMQAMRDIYNAHTHVGNSGVDTSAPNQSM
jgi:phage baseplate assembly protein V